MSLDVCINGKDSVQNLCYFTFLALLFCYFSREVLGVAESLTEGCLGV